MEFTYKKTAEKAVTKSRLRSSLTVLIGALVAAVGVVLIARIKGWVYPGILVTLIGLMIGLFAVIRILQINNLIKTVRQSTLVISEDGVSGSCFLIKGGICLPTKADLPFEEIKSVKSHTPNERSFDYATVEVRSKEESYFFSVDDADRAIIEIRLRITQK